jgi:hypothetical protein
VKSRTAEERRQRWRHVARQLTPPDCDIVAKVYLKGKTDHNGNGTLLIKMLFDNGTLTDDNDKETILEILGDIDKEGYYVDPDATEK